MVILWGIWGKWCRGLIVDSPMFESRIEAIEWIYDNRDCPGDVEIGELEVIS